MGLEECGLNLNRAAMELTPHGSPDFPCGGYATRYTSRPGDIIPWHWHEDFEIIFIKEGTLEIHIPQTIFRLTAGDCLALNSNILHYGITDDYCELRSLVFNGTLLSGTDDSVYARKYIKPLQSCTAFQGHLWHLNDNINTAFYHAFQALAYDTPGFEFTVRETLSQLCLKLCQIFSEEIISAAAAPDQSSLRTQKMLAFIHANFADNIRLSDIARAASIGERECLRCFKRTIQISPVQYLLKYRIQHSVKLLCENPTSSIAEIASQCGFDCQSSFSLLFRRFYNCTPREYRLKNLSQNKLT